jgi:hypothetical protein
MGQNIRLKLITMIYKDNDYETKVTDRSTVQQKLFDIFNGYC